MPARVFIRNNMQANRLERWNLDEVGIFEVNFESGVVYWSREMRRMLGVDLDTPAEFDLLLRRIHPEDRRAFVTMVARTFQPECPRYSVVELRIFGPDDETRRVHIEVARVFNKHGAPSVVRVAGFMINAEAAPASLEHALDVLSHAA
jgi:PAS domain-containing protein